VVPLPDITAEAPEILMAREEQEGVVAVQDKPAISNEERALLVAENSGREFGPNNACARHDIIELIDDGEEDALNDFI
jgi:hypothetical protein